MPTPRHSASAQAASQLFPEPRLCPEVQQFQSSTYPLHATANTHTHTHTHTHTVRQALAGCAMRNHHCNRSSRKGSRAVTYPWCHALPGGSGGPTGETGHLGARGTLALQASPLMKRSSGAIQNGSGNIWCGAPVTPWLSTNMAISCTDSFMSLHTRSSADSGDRFHVWLRLESTQHPRPTPSVSRDTVFSAGASCT